MSTTVLVLINPFQYSIPYFLMKMAHCNPSTLMDEKWPLKVDDIFYTSLNG